MYLRHYLRKLYNNDFPQFILKYLSCPSLLRLADVGYFCGMDYASKDIYDFKETITRFDHSLTTALLVYKLTGDKKMTIAALIHDLSTPCFSHVIDYMNNDYEHQESTEVYTKDVVMGDSYLLHCLRKDGIDPEDVINFKQYSIVDNDRPKLCADRLDGIILTGIGWTKNVTDKEIDEILDNITVFKNENNEDEIGFTNLEVAKGVLEISNKIDEYCHTNEDNYMMMLLADIVKLAISKKYISYEELYTMNEKELFTILLKQKDAELFHLLEKFGNIKKIDIPNVTLPNVKKRVLSPLVNEMRINNDARI